MKEEINKILSEYVIHCDTQKKASKLLVILDRLGCNWRSGHRLLASTNWELFRENTYYQVITKGINKGSIIYGDIMDENIRFLNILTFDEFKELLNMEKEIKIKVPEGYEIDKENSTFECIKFKPIKKAETYNDVARELFLDKQAYFIDTFGRVSTVIPKNDYNDSNNCVTEKQAQKLLAINKLMNVAKYLNKDWKPDWNNANQKKYYLVMKWNTLSTTYSWTIPCGTVAFMNEETILRAKEILGEDTIRLALGDY